MRAHPLRLSLVLLLMSSSGWAARAPHVRFATEGHFKPFNYVEGQELTGFEVELANAIAKKEGLKPEWSTHAFDTLLTGLAKHEYDLVIASHAITPERAQLVEFINPHYCTGAIIVARKGGPTTMSALEGKTVGVAKGTTYYERLKARPRFKEIKIYDTDTDALAALQKGEVQAWVTDRFEASNLVRGPKGTDLELGTLIFPEMVAMAVAKGDNALKKKINDGLEAVMRDGTYEKLSEKYFQSDIRCRDMMRRTHSRAGGG